MDKEKAITVFENKQICKCDKETNTFLGSNCPQLKKKSNETNFWWIY